MSEPASKKAKLDAGDIPGNCYEISEEAKKSLVEIDKVQGDIDKLNEKASDEILLVEQKYNKLRKPFYTTRTAQIKLIPRFWATTLMNHPQFSSIITDEEEELINTVVDVEVDENEDIKSGFRIRMTFSANEFFENDKIEKEYFLSEEAPKTVTTPIKWKAGKEPVGKHGSLCDWLNSSSNPSVDDVAEVLKDDIWPNPLQYYLNPVDIEEGDELDDLLDDEEELEEVDDEGSDKDEA